MSGKYRTIVAECCKFRDCPFPVVGSSTTGQGKVCKGHNEQEWGDALRTYDPPLSAALLRDSRQRLEPVSHREEVEASSAPAIEGAVR
jgi:hypothetical protein